MTEKERFADLIGTVTPLKTPLLAEGFGRQAKILQRRRIEAQRIRQAADIRETLAVNLAHIPEGRFRALAAGRLPLATATSLAVELGPAAGALPAFACLREDLLTSIARGLGQLLGELVAHPAKTTEALLLRLREESCTLGKRVEVNCGGDRRVTGVALDILPDTALLVKTDAGEELPITAGDVGVLPMGP